VTGETFADAGYWIALLSPDDDLHASAVRLSAELGSTPLVTTDSVLGEVLTFFCETGERSRRAAADLAWDCLGDPGVHVVPVDRELFLEGLRLYEQRPDKGYSLVDCTSFALMRQRANRAALTPDHHFEQEGFVVLMGR
jgi:predicted nucleic acid-binding protein